MAQAGPSAWCTHRRRYSEYQKEDSGEILLKLILAHILMNLRGICEEDFPHPN